MRIKVKVHDYLKTKLDPSLPLHEGAGEIDLPPGAAVRNLIAALGLPAELVGLIIAGGRQVLPDRELRDGETVELFAPLAGG